MIVDTINGEIVVDIREELFSNINLLFAVVPCDEWTPHGFTSKNLKYYKIDKTEVDNKLIFEAYVRYYGANAYEKLLTLGFNFKII